MIYPLLRQLLFLLDPETAHNLSLKAISAAEKLKLINGLGALSTAKHKQVMGINFPNPVGLAAGLDKNADHIDGLGALGFGFIEVGTVTPRPQPGNPKPRLFRIPEKKAIINRMGFNNLGVDHLLARVAERRYVGVLGINIGKNFDTPVEDALEDYLIGLRKVYAAADYVTVNISSPNTPGLRNLQFGESLKLLMSGIKEEQAKLAAAQGLYKPIAVKIAPDMSAEEIAATAAILLEFELDGVIATNTTLSRVGVESFAQAEEAGGLSGAPLTDMATQVLALLCTQLAGKIPVIAAGGIMDTESAQAKLDAGASLLQLYTGFIYNGPGLIKDILKAI